MVSLSGAVLIPAIQNDNAVQTTIDTHRENIAEETLLTMLVSKIDKFTYNTGIQSYEQRHKTYANLIAENLAFQKKGGLISSDFTKKLKKEIQNCLTDFLGEKYGFSFTAKWVVNHKILGKIEFGDTLPEKDSFLARTNIMMPINTVSTFNNVYSSITGVTADSSDLPEIQKAEVKLVLWEVKG